MTMMWSFAVRPRAWCLRRLRRRLACTRRRRSASVSALASAVAADYGGGNYGGGGYGRRGGY